MAAFGALVVATVAAFFVTQHLKVTTPLIAGAPAPDPAWINPLDGVTCGPPDKRVNHRVMRISFYLLHRSDDVDVDIVDPGGAIVATLATDVYMRGGAHPVRTLFTWDGREDDGQIAPDGAYYIRVTLLHQGRTVEIANAGGTPEPVMVRTVAPDPVVTGVSPSTIPRSGAMSVVIHYTGDEGRAGTVRLYRTGLAGGPKLIKSFPTPWNGASVVWNGTVRGERPAPQGTYLIGLDVTDEACNTGRFPPVMPPPAGSTRHAGVTVQYLAASPPLTPVAPAARALVTVQAAQRGYSWSLERVGASSPVAGGSAHTPELSVPVPAGAGGLYELSLRSGDHATQVPIVAGAVEPASKVLVVLPALTWQGLNPVDDDGDGLPDTLAGGQAISLLRPLIDGLPAGWDDEAGLLAYLDSAHLPYDLTTDLGLLAGRGPSLSDYRAVVLAGSERWLPRTLLSALGSYVQRGGNVLSFGIDSLRATVTVRLPVAGSLRGATASDPSRSSGVDAFGARPGAPLTHSVSDFRLGRGRVVEIDIERFGASLAHSSAARQVVRRLWTVLGS